MQINKQITKQLHPGIKITKKYTVIDQQPTYLFSLDVQELKEIDFQSDFTGSENISLKGMSSYERIIFKTVAPRTMTQVAHVELHQGWKLVTKFRFRRRPISKQKQLQYIQVEIKSLRALKTTVQTIMKKVDIALTPLEQINRILEKSLIKFIDSEFPPEQISIVGNSDKNLIDETVNQWRRPSEIFGPNYHVFYQINHHNLIQGKLLDNSFYSVVVCLTLTNQNLLERLFFNMNTVNPNGVYKLRFCKNGEWQTVTIDDLLPCQPLAKPKFSSSKLDEIWFSLLQKGYAKLHKKYLAIHDLQVSNVFNDLTGCPTYITLLSDPEARRVIFQEHKNKSLVVFYAVEDKQFDEDEFIPWKNYAYPLISFDEISGKMEFKILSHNHEKQEITEQQLFKKFKCICVCHVRNWQQVRIKGKFITAEAGTQTNSYPISMSKWYYTLELPQASDIHVCLHQEDVLIGSNQSFKPFVYCSLLLLQKSDKSILKPIQINKYEHNRQIHIKAFLQQGMYLIIPFINSESSIKKPPTEEDQIVDIFKKLDLLMKRELKYPQLVPFYKVCGQVFDEEIFNDLLKDFSKGKKGIGLQAFRQLWAKNRIYWKDCLQYYQKERLFTLSVHSNIEISILIKNNIGTEFNNRAHCELIGKLGIQIPSKQSEKYAKLTHYVSKCHIVEYMVENRHDRKIQIDLNCTESNGYHFYPEGGKCVSVLDSGQREFVMKLVPFQKCEIKELKKVEKFKVKLFD